MKLIDRLRSAPPEAFSLPQRFQSMPFQWGGTTTAGIRIDVDTAVELIPVYSAVNLIASAIGSLPCKVYSGSTRDEARGSRQWRLLHDRPNPEIAADEFWQWVTGCLLLWGNAFIYKKRDAAGVVQELWPIRPSRVMVGREADDKKGDTRRFFMLDGSGKYYDVDILHIRGLSTDGLVGYSPVQQARQQLANDVAQQEFLGTFLKNGLFSSAVFTHPNHLSKDAQDRLSEQIDNRSGWLSAGKTIMLEEGSDLKNLTMSLVDSEFMATAKMSEHRIAQLFGLVPPHTWGATDQGKTMTYQNSEFGGLEFVKWTLRPWLVRVESAVGADQGVFPTPGPTLFPEFLVDALLRADTAARWQAYELGFGKWINAEWIHEVENIVIPAGTEIVPQSPADQSGVGVGQIDQPAPAGEDVSRSLEVLGQRTLPSSNGLVDVLDDLRSIMRPEVRVDAPVTVLPATQLPPDIVVNEADHSEALLAVAASLDRLGELVAAKDVQVNVDVNVPEQPAPVVNVPETPVQLTLLDEGDAGPKEVVFRRDRQGRISSAVVSGG